MKKNILILSIGLCFSQVAYAAGKSSSSNSQEGSVYIISEGVVKRSPECDLIDPVKVYERLSQIDDTNYICYSDGEEYFEYVARAGDKSVEIEIGLEDNSDGTWYGYVFEYKLEVENALPDAVYSYDLTLEQAQACRAAFEPPFTCTE